MTFDVAIHTYNRADLLPETLDGVLRQSLAPGQIVVVDDGSTDQTEQVVAAYGDRLEYHQIANVGPGASRHAAIAACRGDWIACTDDDDLWLPDHLAVMQSVIDATEDVDVVFTNFRLFGETETEEQAKFEQAPAGWWQAATRGDEIKRFNEDAYLHFLSFNPVFFSCIAFRREHYERIGGSNVAYSRRKSEDAELTRRLVLYGRVACAAAPTVRIRRHATNFSANASLNLLGKARILQDHLEQGILPPGYSRPTQAAIDETLLQAFRCAYWNNDYRTMQQAYEKIGRFRLTFRDYLRLLAGKFRARIGTAGAKTG